MSIVYCWHQSEETREHNGTHAYTLLHTPTARDSASFLPLTLCTPYLSLSSPSQAEDAAKVGELEAELLVLSKTIKQFEAGQD